MDDVSARRSQQAELYGESVDVLARRLHQVLGLPAHEVASTIGVSGPMFTQVLEGRRSRFGNPLAILRLRMLHDFLGHLEAGVADRADIALTLAQIRVATTPVPGVPPSVPIHPGRHGSGVPSGGAAVSLGITAASLALARERVGRHVEPTAVRRWPLLERLTGTETWVKHENHNPTGAFKVRGGLNYVARLLTERAPEAGPVPGLVSATRGNHGQSLAFAGATHGVPVTIVVPEGNSPDKNAAMEAYGARLVVHGADFQEAREHAGRLAADQGLLAVPAFHPWLVEGVASCAAELHTSVPDLDVVYVPVGMGSGICAQLVVRDLLARHNEVVGVVSAEADAYARSFEAGRPISTPSADTFVDGVACREPDAQAVALINAGAARIVRVSEEQAAEAMGLMYRATHNLAEPAGSLALAGLLAERDRVAGRRVAVVHTGGNTDFTVLSRAMAGGS
ncbi:threonine dehydratase [Nocardioides pacificus]